MKGCYRIERHCYSGYQQAFYHVTKFFPLPLVYCSLCLSPKIRLESKLNTTFRVVSVEKFP